MAQTITAYLANDGKLHLDKNEADYSDFSGEISQDVGDFLKIEKADDKDGHIKKMLIRWELWKHGDFAGWLASRQPAQAAAPAPEAIEAKPVKAVAPVKPALKLPTAEPVPFKKLIGIVGLMSMHHKSIEKEFDAEFKIDFLNITNSKLPAIRDYKKVFFIKTATNTGFIKAFRDVGHEPLVIQGGLAKLIEELTNFYVAG